MLLPVSPPALIVFSSLHTAAQSTGSYLSVQQRCYIVMIAAMAMNIGRFLAWGYTWRYNCNDELRWRGACNFAEPDEAAARYVWSHGYTIC